MESFFRAFGVWILAALVILCVNFFPAVERYALNLLPSTSVGEHGTENGKIRGTLVGLGGGDCSSTTFGYRCRSTPSQSSVILSTIPGAPAAAGGLLPLPAPVLRRQPRQPDCPHGPRGPPLPAAHPVRHRCVVREFVGGFYLERFVFVETPPK